MCIFSEQASWREGNAGNYVYKNGTLEFFNHTEGIVEHEADGYKYVYQFKDHLGNIRLSYKDADGNGSITQSEIVQEKNYYPFGMTHSGYNTNLRGRKHNYGYNGKEENNELGLNWIDYGARNYDPAIGKWFNIDPQAEKYYDQSPFTYGLNNPTYFIDPNGEEIDVTSLTNNEDKDEDQQNRDAWLLINLMVELADISGQKVSKSQTKDGRTVLTGSGECDGDCSEAGAFVSHLLSDEGTVTVSGTNEGSEGFPGGQVYLDASQINGLQEGLKEQGLNPLTDGVGMTFLHESLHTKFGASFFNSSEDQKNKIGGRFKDPFQGSKRPGNVVSRINRFREQLGLATRERYFEEYDNKVNPTLLFKKDGNEYIIQSRNIKPKK